MRLLLAAALLSIALNTGASVPTGVYLQELSSSDVREALQAGKRTLIVPVGGTEQSGPHMALGKHNFRVHELAGRIAAQLGNALVAPSSRV